MANVKEKLENTKGDLRSIIADLRNLSERVKYSSCENVGTPECAKKMRDVSDELASALTELSNMDLREVGF